MNVRISNVYEYKLCPSFFENNTAGKERINYPFKTLEKYKHSSTIGDVKDTLTYLSDMRSLLQQYGVFNYLDFYNVYCDFMWGEESGYENTNPYDRMQINDWPGKAFFEYVSNPDETFKKEDDFPIELKRKMMVKPVSLKDIPIDPKKDPKKIVDPKSGQPLYQVLNMFERFERNCVVDDAAFGFIMHIANNEIEVMDEYKESLKKLNIIKNEKSLLVLKQL